MDRCWLLAIGLVLVIEGLMPFAAPRAWRQTMNRVASFKDGQIRFMGLAALALGLLLLLI